MLSILSLAISKYFLSNSIPIKFLLVFMQATPVEPLPIVKSRTKSPSLVYVFIKYSNNATGFCVGCTRLKLAHSVACIEIFMMFL